MYLLIVFLPLLGSITAGFLGRWLGKYGAAIVTATCVGLSTLFSLIAFYEVGLAGSPVYIKLFTWIDSEMLHASWAFLFDSLTVVMLIVVTIVSTLVHIYSIGYMSHDPHLPRFMSYLSLFTFFMLMLVTGDNFIQMFLGWEGVGLCSYLLINFWFTRLQANKAAIKAMIMNRIGDFGLTLGIMAIFFVFKAVDFATVFALAPYMTDLNIVIFGYELHALTIICIFLFIGAVGKSAQLGLHTWLPDAMEGPTPVSALIHAATMVTAGVFLIVRCSPLFEYAPNALLVVTFVGAITAFFAATTGMLQNDLKRVIAYSTCSQLGYMTFACGISSYSVSMFHLMNHAFFKALLFLSAGCVIHAMADEQDMRKMGGLVRIIPFTYGMMLIGSLSLMGFPFLTGFYSKDVILELAYAKYSVGGTFSHWLGTVSAFFTAFYSFRLIYLTFLSSPNGPRTIISHAHDAPPIMGIPLLILAVGSIFVGYVMKDMIIGLGTNFWGNAIYTQPQNLSLIESEFIPTYIKLFPVILSIIGATLAIILNAYYPRLLLRIKHSSLGREVYSFLNKRWYFDIVYNEMVGRKLLSFGYNVSFGALDKGLIEIVGPYGLERSIRKIASQTSALQSGYLYHYAFTVLIGLTLLITTIGLWDYLSAWFDYRLYIVYLIAALFYHYSSNNE
jgi:NADH-ubiquinone oxidoreductase chain 5